MVRTVHSLVYILPKTTKFIFVSPKSLRVSMDVIDYLEDHDCAYEESTDVKYALSKSEVVYWTRIQRERMDNIEWSNSHSYVIDSEMVKYMKPYAILMHPLPRVNEITTDVDKDFRSRYFEQAGNGMCVRMALLEWVLGRL